MMPKINRDVYSGCLLVALAVYLWSITTTFPRLTDGYPGPALFPQIIAILLGLIGLYLALAPLLFKQTASPASPASENDQQKGRLLRFSIGILLVLTYPLLVDRVHFMISMAGFILLFGLVLSNPPWKAILTALLSAGLIYTLFTQLLGVPL